MIQAWMLDTMDEIWKAPRRLYNGLRLAKGDFRPNTAQTPSQEIARWGRARLLRYDVVGPVKACPILVVPSIINRFYILDLRPGESLVEFLVQAGIPVYMLDWGEPGPQDRFKTLEDHVLRFLGAAVRTSSRDAGVKAIHLLGYCVGGTFAVAYAALQPRRVAGLVALTTPISFHDDGILSAIASGGHINVDQLNDHFGLIPGWFLQGGFLGMKPIASLQKYRVFAERLWDDKFVERFWTLETWLNDNVDIPGETYKSLINELYVENRLIEGKLELGGRPVRLADIDCPVLTAVSKRDVIVPDPSAAVLHDLVSSKDRTLMRFDGGHIGVTVGRSAQTAFWPALRDWLTERPCPETRTRVSI